MHDSTAIHYQDLSRDEVTVVRSKKDAGSKQVLGLLQSLHRVRLTSYFVTSAMDRLASVSVIPEQWN